MPVPGKRKNENSSKFMSRCMSDPTMQKEYKNSEQRVAICIQQSKGSLFERADIERAYSGLEWDDEWNEWIEEVEMFDLYDSETGLSIAIAAEDKGRKAKLNKPFRTPSGPKKFAVYVKNKKGNIVVVRFGDPEMRIRKNDPDRRRAFKARHRCDEQTDKTTPAYWSCKWSW